MSQAVEPDSMRPARRALGKRLSDYLHWLFHHLFGSELWKSIETRFVPIIQDALAVKIELTAARYAWLYGRLPLIFLSIVYVFAVVFAADSRPLWSDEIFTFIISSSNGPVAVLEALLNKADYNPPTDYLLRHLSLTLFGESELALRLPSIVLFLVTSICLYKFVAKRAPSLPAIVAFSFPLSTLALDYAYEGRAYSLLMASMGLALLAWQSATDRPNKTKFILLAVSLSLGPFSHFYGVLNYIPILVGETWRSYERRKICWPLVFSVLASLAPLPLLYPLVATAIEFKSGFWTSFGLGTPLYFYSDLFGDTVFPVMVAVICILVIVSIAADKQELPTTLINVPRHEIAAAIALCLIPFVTYAIATLLTNALTVRYAIVTILGGALLAAYGTHLAALRRHAFGMAIAGSFVLFGAASLMHVALAAHKSPPRLDTRLQEFVEQQNLPIVINGIHSFLPLHHYLPESLRNKIYYLVDTDYAFKHLSTDSADRSLNNLKPHTTAQIVNYCNFIATRTEFNVLSLRGSWVVQRLLRDNAQLTLQKTGGLSTPAFHVRVSSTGQCMHN